MGKQSKELLDSFVRSGRTEDVMISLDQTGVVG